MTIWEIGIANSVKSVCVVRKKNHKKKDVVLSWLMSKVRTVWKKLSSIDYRKNWRKVGLILSKWNKILSKIRKLFKEIILRERTRTTRRCKENFYRMCLKKSLNWRCLLSACANTTPTKKCNDVTQAPKNERFVC